MTLLASGALTDGGNLVGRTQALVTDVTTAIPEPGSLGLLGIALIGFAVLRRSMRADA